MTYSQNKLLKQKHKPQKEPRPNKWGLNKKRYLKWKFSVYYTITKISSTSIKTNWRFVFPKLILKAFLDKQYH